MKLTLPKFRILDEATCDDIRRKALEILRKKGFRVYNTEMRKRLHRIGASVDESREIVTLPQELIDEAISACPSEFYLYDLDGKPTRYAEGTILDTIGTYVEAIAWLDYGAETLRPSTLADLEKGLKVADVLKLVNYTGTIVWPMDFPVEQQLRTCLRTILTVTRKSLSFGVQNRNQAHLIFDALTIAAPQLDLGKQPVFNFVISPTSPFVLDKDSAEVLIFSLEKGMIPLIAPCPMAGGTSQFSIMGTVLQQVAENLFMLTAKFAISPESPVLWGGAAAAMDMKAGDVCYGGVERSLMMLANMDMACYYGVPCHSPSSSVDSCLVDAQMGAEKAWTYLTRAFSRAAAGMGIGAVTNGKAVSVEVMVIDADIINSIRRLVAGIETDRLETAVQEIFEIEHGGNFMMSAATLDLLHEGKEYFYPATFNRKGTDGPSIMQRAHEKVELILAEWKNPVEEKICVELEKLLGERKN